MNSDKYVVSFECSETARDNLIPLLEYFEMMGLLGMTRDFTVDDDTESKWFTFDGDGPDRLANIKIKSIQ